VLKDSHDNRVLEAIKAIVVEDYYTKLVVSKNGSIKSSLCNKGDGEIHGAIGTKSTTVYQS